MRRTTEIDRVREDLATMRHAAGVEMPFGRELVYFWCAIATGCAMLALTLAFGSVKSTGIVLTVLWVGGALLLLGALIGFVRIVKDRPRHPAAWRELRDVGMAKLVGAPLLGGFLFWQVRTGADPRFVLSSLVFYASLFTVLYAMTSWTRRWAFGISLPGLAMGAALPVVALSRLPLVIALTGVAMGVLSASIHAWALRHTGTPA